MYLYNDNNYDGIEHTENQIINKTPQTITIQKTEPESKRN